MEEELGSRPASVMASRPATAAASRPVSSRSARSRPTSSMSYRQASRPASGASFRPTSGLSLRPSRPASGLSMKPSRPASSSSMKSIGRPGTSEGYLEDNMMAAQSWTESEKGPSSPRSEISGDDTVELIANEVNVKKGCWHTFSQCVAGVWTTREMTPPNDTELFAQATVRELAIYCTFLVVLSMVTFGMTSTSHYYYTNVMSALFVWQPQIQNVDDFWVFLNGEMQEVLFWESWYADGQNKRQICPGGEETAGPCPLAPEERNVLYENRILGLPRLRQLRVYNGSCDIHPDFQSSITQCYAPYKYYWEDTNDYIPPYRNHTSLSAWQYQTAEEMGTSSMTIPGQYGRYSGNGYVQTLHSVRNETKAMMYELQESLWLQRSTRAVFLDFTVYNANLNLFCVVCLLFEFPATGGTVPSATFRTVKLIRYVSMFDYFIMACEGIYTLFIIYYLVEETLEILKIGGSYFKSFYNNLDVIVVILSAMNQGLSVYTFLVVESQLSEIIKSADSYADFQDLGYWSDMFKSFIAICVFFSWVKLFKYITFNRTMTQLASTLDRCGGDIAGFGVMFFIVFFAYAQLGYLLFGTTFADYSTFDTAVFTLLRTILGDFDFHTLEASNRILGPIFFMTYFFFVFFVLLNMFLAIINDTYSEIKEEVKSAQNAVVVSDYFKRGYNNMMSRVGMRNKLLDIEFALRMAAADGEITYEEIRQNLKKCNFSDMEIEMFFAKYDEDGDGQFSMKENSLVMKDLDKDIVDSQSRPTSSGPGGARRGSAQAPINHGEFAILGTRIIEMESVIENIVTKIDTVLIKLESMERSKTKRRANASRILDVFTADTPEGLYGIE